MNRAPRLASLLPAALMAAAFLAACGPDAAKEEVPVATSKKPATPAPKETRLATFGNGCFWCSEAVFLRVEGVLGVESGYSGGTVDHPTYEEVSSGTTGHAEVVQVRYDPAKVRYEQLLEVFWKTHDPTTLNRQGNDVGTQYRSVVFFHDDEQKRIAEDLKARLNAANAFPAPIVTQIVPFERFWKAEDYHQDYFAGHPNQPYCRLVVGPKVEKFEKLFHDLVKKP